MLPPAIFKNVFDVCNFSIIPNFFHSDKLTPYIARIIKNVPTNCIIFGGALKIRVKKFKQNLLEIDRKSTKNSHYIM